MKIQLPNGEKLVLDDNIELKEKINLVEELTKEWMFIILGNWDSNSTKFFLDSLANYLVWHKEIEKEVENKEDKEVMSRNKTNRLHRGRKDIPFSSLTANDRELLFGEGRGLEDE